IVGLGGSGNLAGNVQLQSDQILLGGASTLAVHGVTSGTSATFAPGGTRPTIVDTSGGPAPVVWLGTPLDHGPTIKGVSIVGNNDGNTFNFNDVAVFVHQVDGALVRDVDVTGAGVGVWDDNSANVVVDSFSSNAVIASGIGAYVIGATNATLTNLNLA